MCTDCPSNACTTANSSAGWLQIVDQWLDFPDNVKQQLVEVAMAMPGLLSACLSLLTDQEDLRLAAI